MALNTEVPQKWDVAINGRGYMLDLTGGRASGPTSLRITRNQQDTANKAGEQSLARENLWRRVMTSWHHGAGQRSYDDTTGDPYRFYKSLGIDVWTQGQARALGPLARTPIPTANAGHIVGTRPNQMILYNDLPYVSGDTNCASAFNVFSAAANSCTVPNGILSWCTDGATVYIADAGGGGTGGAIYTTTMGGGAATLYVAAGTYYLARWALGRLWAADTAGLYNITGAATRTLAYTDPTTTWTWTDVVAGDGGVLASGYDKTHSNVTLVGLLPDGSGIDGGVVIAEMPAGENILSMHSYLGYILLGTNRGVRVCKHSGATFTVGPLIDIFSADANAGFKAPSTTAVRCFASFERFVYFGWSFYDWTGQESGTETSGNFYAGLGRLDLSTMLDTLQPAYATDVMGFIDNQPVYTSGEVTGCCVDKWGVPAYVVHGDECYTGGRSGTPAKTIYRPFVISGNYLRMGNVGLGIDDIKTWSRWAVSHDPVDTTPGVLKTFTWNFRDRSSTYGPTITFASGGTTTTTDMTDSTGWSPSLLPSGPSTDPSVTWVDQQGDFNILRIYDLRLEAWPSPPRVERWQLPLLLRTEVQTRDDQTVPVDVAAELSAIAALGGGASRAVVDFQFLGSNYKAVVDDWEFVPEDPGKRPGEAHASVYQGTLIVTLSRQVL